MNKETLEKRLEELEKAIVQGTAQLNALFGAKTELINLIAYFDSNKVEIGNGIDKVVAKAKSLKSKAKNGENLRAS